MVRSLATPEPFNLGLINELIKGDGAAFRTLLMEFVVLTVFASLFGAAQALAVEV